MTNVIDITAFVRRPLPAPTPVRIYHCMLRDGDVTLGELVHALRQSTICVTTDPTTGNQILHRRPEPEGAA